MNSVSRAFTADLTDFRAHHGLDHVVVVNVTSTEPASGGVGLPPEPTARGAPPHAPAGAHLHSLREKGP